MAFGSALMNKGMCPVNQTDGYHRNRFVAVFAPNILEWYLLDLVCMVFGLQLAPLYDTLGEDTVHYVLNQTKVKTLALSASHVDLIIKLKNSGQL